MGFENRLRQNEDTVNENERGLSFNRGLFFYLQKSYLVFECKRWSFSFDSTTKTKIKLWKSTGIENLSRNSDMDAVEDSGNDFPDIKNDGRMYVYLSGNYFKQNKVVIPKTNFNVINIYCVYELQPISSLRDTSFTIQNALFGAMQILKILQIIQRIIIKDTDFVLMKEVILVTQ